MLKECFAFDELMRTWVFEHGPNFRMIDFVVPAEIQDGVDDSVTGQVVLVRPEEQIWTVVQTVVEQDVGCLVRPSFLLELFEHDLGVGQEIICGFLCSGVGRTRQKNKSAVCVDLMGESGVFSQALRGAFFHKEGGKLHSVFVGQVAWGDLFEVLSGQFVSEGFKEGLFQELFL